jgi:hypothetical protein
MRRMRHTTFMGKMRCTHNSDLKTSKYETNWETYEKIMDNIKLIKQKRDVKIWTGFN